MTEKQNTLYWREWGKVTRACKDNGMAAPDRHELHRQALKGKDKSHTKFSNPDFDSVLAVFRSWSQPGDIRAQMRQEDQPLIRLRFRIRELADEKLVASLVQDRFAWSVWLRKHYPEAEGVTLAQAPSSIVAEYRDSGLSVTLDDLAEWQLVQLRDTLCARKTGSTQRREGSEEELVSAGGEGRPF